jgi:outer membrane protein assembly factor BamE (lipoprotein component of BamABCDE complex)
MTKEVGQTILAWILGGAFSWYCIAYTHKHALTDNDRGIGYLTAGLIMTVIIAITLYNLYQLALVGESLRDRRVFRTPAGEIKQGLSRQRIEEIIGRPHRIFSQGKVKVLRYHIADGKRLIVYLQKDKVKDIKVVHPAFEKKKAAAGASQDGSSKEKIESIYSNVKRGFTPPEVSKVLGKPHHATTFKDVDIWHYFYESKRAAVYFINGKVVEMREEEEEQSA